MSKNILLGCAAAFVVVGGAHAADLPVKAKPVEYVKVCAAYGAGFFYVPGTDTCIKIGGWVRAEYAFQTGNSAVEANQGSLGRNNRIDTDEYRMRARWTTSIDVRTQTEYGTLRAYTRAASMTGAAGTLLAAYTATFGNGFTATLSIEDQWMRRNGIWDAGTDALVISNMPGPGTVQDSYNPAAINMGDYGSTQIPDIVGSLRVDQAWGSAQIAGALHQNRAGYYGNNSASIAAGPAAANFLGPNGYTGLAPGDTFGWAAMGGVVINLPWNKGDKF